MPKRCLEVTVGSTAALKENRASTRQDPFAIVRLGDVAHRTDSDPQAGSRPVWNHRFSFLLPEDPGDASTPQELHVEVWDKSEGGDKYIGACTLPLSQVHARGSMDAVQAVHRKSGKLLGHIRFHLSILVEDPAPERLFPASPPSLLEALQISNGAARAKLLAGGGGGGGPGGGGSDHHQQQQRHLAGGQNGQLAGASAGADIAAGGDGGANSMQELLARIQLALQQQQMQHLLQQHMARQQQQQQLKEEEEQQQQQQQHKLVPDAGEPQRWLEGVQDLMSLLRLLGQGFRLLCSLRCQEAVEAFLQLPPEHYSTFWVLCQVGRAHYEMVEYAEAERAFASARRAGPHALDSLAIYSTVLFHMKKEVELSYLAQEAIALDRLSPEAWCIMGNCMSLQKEHESALKFFQRAAQLDPCFTYAHTLAGHEYVAMEEFEDGLACYRTALRLDSRHYNAWYGLGSIYMRQEKYELAQYHIQRAVQINPRSSVLHCYLGMALHALKRNEEALEELQMASALDARNPLPMYERANVLLSAEKLSQALGELEALLQLAPRESSVYFLLGKVYKRLEQPEKAMLHFSLALDHKPSSNDANLIKAAIEKLHEPESFDGDM